MDELMPATNHWSHLLGMRAVPDVRTGSAALVVSGKRCSSLADVVRAVGLPVADGHAPALFNDDGADADADDSPATEHSLARVYYRRLLVLQGKDPAEALPTEDARARRLRQQRESADRCRAERNARVRAKREAAQAEKRAARQAWAAELANSLEARLAAIDADESLTPKQRAARKYYARNQVEINDMYRRKREQSRLAAREQTPCA